MGRVLEEAGPGGDVMVWGRCTVEGSNLQADGSHLLAIGGGQRG